MFEIGDKCATESLNLLKVRLVNHNKILQLQPLNTEKQLKKI